MSAEREGRRNDRGITDGAAAICLEGHIRGGRNHRAGAPAGTFVLVPQSLERFWLRDGYAVESVAIRRHDGMTACISSQVGCAFACRFCASGQAGLIRNLSAAEIVEQVVRLGPRVNRIVFMGIGEPLNNYEQVIAAIRILRDRRGLAFPTAGITKSTSRST